MKSILVISPTYSYPARSGGDIRLLELLRRLSKVYELHLITYGDHVTNEFLSYTGVKSATIIFGGQSLGVTKGWRYRLDIWRDSPHGLRLNLDKAFADELIRLLASLKIDAVIIEHLYMVQYRNLIKNIPIFVSCHNVESLKMRRWFAGFKGRFTDLLRKKVQVLVMQYHESRLSDYAKAVFTTSDFDSRLLTDLNKGGRFVTVPNGASLDYFQPRSYDSFFSDRAAVFVGSLFYQPNYEAVVWLKDEIWPLVRQTIPDALCHIVGNPGDMVLDSLNDSSSGIIYHGLVPDIRPYLTISQVMVVPIRVGSGTRIKIIESMASATPVVSTTVGAEGIDCTHNKNILLADTSQAIASSIIRLLTNGDYAYSIGKEGRDLVKKKYSWDLSSTLIENEVNRVLN